MNPYKDKTRTELIGIINEFKSERDAAKRANMRCFDERNILLDRLNTTTKDMEYYKELCNNSYQRAYPALKHGSYS